jgi:ribonuclease D
VAANETLLQLARAAPQSVQELRSFRGLSRGEVEKEGERIVQAIQKGKALKRTRPVSEWDAGLVENSTVSFLMTYVGLLAERLKIASRFLLTSGAAGNLVYLTMKGRTEWREILSPHASVLIGNEIEALLKGECGLVLKKGRLETASFV